MQSANLLIFMKNSIFLSSLLAVCVTCVAQAETMDELLVTSGSRTYDSLTTNHLTIGYSGGVGTVTVAGTTTINPNQTQANSCQIQAGSTLISKEIIFNSSTDALSRQFIIFGTVKTDKFSVSADDTYEASVSVMNGAIVESLSGGAATLEIGKDVTLKVGAKNGKVANAGTINVTTEILDGASLNVYQNATMSDINLDGGTINILQASDPTALGLQEVAIISDLTMNSGTLNISGDIKTGSLTLNGGTVYTSADYVIDLGENDLILGDNVAITLNVDSLDNIEGVTLFKNAGNVTGLDALTVTFVDATGAEKEAAVSFSNGSVVTGSIPEPTTATLSLLALAGLAARRRRASR